RYRGSDSSWETIATLAPNATSYTDTGLRSGRRYKYRVRATRGTDSAASNQVNVTVP
ncbi:MAG: fibronectin type III domain-containing protein, partial [Acidobacteria bacterium]|nr:fibronectin type III domain-containing protein [Acidobacteriota bacterium]